VKSIVPRFIRLVILTALALFLSMLQTSVKADPIGEVILEQDRSVHSLGESMRSLADDSHGLGAIVSAFEDGAFNDDFDRVSQSISPYQPVWAATVLTNSAPDDGRVADTWILEVRTYGIVATETHLIRSNGLTEALLRHSIQLPFEPSNYSGTQLRTAPIRLAPGEIAILMTKQVFGPVAQLDFALMTEADHENAVFTSSILTTAWYAFLIACLVFHFGFSLSMRSRVGIGYGCALTLGLLFIAYLDGFLFRFFYPERPEWHLGIGITVLLLTAATGFASAGLSLRDLADKGRGIGANWAGVSASLLGIVAVPFLSPEIMANIAYLTLILMLASQVAAARQWRLVLGKPRIMLQGLTIALVVVVTTVLVLMFAGLSGSWMPFDIQIKAIFSATALWTIAALSIGLVSMRREHEVMLRRELQAVSERERVTRELLESEKNYTRARAVADQRRAQLATASHDFRQPLASLRLTLSELGGGLGVDQRQRLEDAFDYMEDLSTDLLHETSMNSNAGDTEISDEPYPLTLVIETVAQMFSKEAEAKGVGLRFVMSSKRVSVPPLILTRIVSNLVANAVKYTHVGRVAVGVRSDGPSFLRLIVCDTGPGITEAEIERLSRAYEKGSDSTGTGLGLAICYDLASQHGLDLTVQSHLGRGTRFSLKIPMTDLSS